MQELAVAVILGVITYCGAWLIAGLPTLAKLAFTRGWLVPRSTTLSSAGISRDLVPRVNQYVTAGAVVHIVGSGYYAQTHQGAFWLKSLQAWLDRGAVVHYLLIDPHSAGQEKLKLLVAHPKFHLHSRVAPGESNLMRKYSTFHPLLVEMNNGDRLMWIEHCHPKDSPLAFEVDFVAPSEARHDSRFDVFLADFDALKGEMSERPSARSAA